MLTELSGWAITAVVVLGVLSVAAGIAVFVVDSMARATFALIGLWGVRQHRMLAAPTLAATIADAPIVLKIALPAVLTNLAPSVASAFIAHALAKFGAVAVAGNVVIDRLTPVQVQQLALIGRMVDDAAAGPTARGLASDQP